MIRYGNGDIWQYNGRRDGGRRQHAKTVGSRETIGDPSEDFLFLMGGIAA